jgi:hypothetical protein
MVTNDLETEVIIGKRNKKVKVWKAKFNKMGIRDIYEEGCRKMILVKISDISFCCCCQIKQEIATLQKELNNYLSNKDGESKMKLLKEKLMPKQTDSISDRRVEYWLMKKQIWSMPAE